MRPEEVIQRRIMLALSKAGVMIFRNAVTVAWVGRAVRQDRGEHGIEVVLRHAQRVTTGLCKGSADLVGVTQDGRFVAIEVKTETGRLSPEQRNWLEAMRARGALAGVARSPEEALAIVRGESGESNAHP